jgi:3D (Asp-Asp-Asp) domain-containing protein
MDIISVHGAASSSGLQNSMMYSRLLAIAFVSLCASVLASCAALQEAPPEKQRTLLVTATAFNSLPPQGQGNPSVGAWGDPIAPGMHALAVSADLIALGLTRGMKVRIDGLPSEYVVLDRMPAKWKKRIDIYMGSNVQAARSWGRREVNIHWTVSDESQP